MHKLGIIAIVFALIACEKVDDTANNPYKALDLTTKSAELVQKGSAFNLNYIESINAAIGPYSQAILEAAGRGLSNVVKTLPKGALVEVECIAAR